MATILNLLRYLFSFIIGTTNKSENQTKVILLFNTDSIRSIIGPNSSQELTIVSLNSEKDKNQIAVRMKQVSDPSNELNKVSLIGQMDHNLLSFLTNILLAHPIQSLVILRREKPDTRKRVQHVLAKSTEKTPNDDIFTYAPSRAEREHLEERF